MESIDRRDVRKEVMETGWNRKGDFYTDAGGRNWKGWRESKRERDIHTYIKTDRDTERHRQKHKQKQEHRETETETETKRNTERLLVGGMKAGGRMGKKGRIGGRRKEGVKVNTRRKET